MPNTPQPPKRRRRWFRYSLRTLLVVVTIFCIVLAIWTHRAKRQQAVVKWVEENGGSVRYDFEFELDGSFADPKPLYPKWLLEFLGYDYLATVVYANLRDTQIKDIAPLAKIEQLESLYLDRMQVSDLQPLGELKSLKVLHLTKTQVRDLKPLAHLTSLEHLDLGNTQVRDLTPLASLTNLKDLLLINTQVSDLEPLAGLTSLKVLLLDNTQVSDLTPLGELPNLKHLQLENTQVSDLTPLSGLTSLEYLFLDNTQVTQEQINSLQKALPNCKINWTPPDKAIEMN